MPLDYPYSERPFHFGKILPSSKKKNKKAISKGVRDDVWEKNIGKRYSGECYVCGKTINTKNFEVGHKRARSKGGSNRISNLRPICKKCNRSMGTMSIDAYKEKYYCPPKKNRQRKTRKKIRRKKAADPFSFRFHPI